MTSPVNDPVDGSADHAGWFVLACAVVLAAGLYTPLATIGREALQFDEAMHFVAARQPSVGRVVANSRRYTHPPGAFLFFHTFRGLGHSEGAARLPSLIFFGASFVMGIVWLRAEHGNWPALASAAILVGSRPYVRLAVEMRAYTFLMTVLFTALWLRVRFLRTGSWPALAGSTLCFGVAVLTHYSVALLLLVVGIATLVRFLGGTSSGSTVAAWCASQVALMGVCLFAASHALGFRGSEIAANLWIDWLANSSFDPTRTSPFALTLLRTCEFLGFLVGSPAWVLLVLVVVLGAFILATSSGDSQPNGGGWLRAERLVLILLPWLIAMLAFHLRVYPIGRTRHSMWVLPFLLYGIAAGVVPIARRWPRLNAGIVLTAFGVWFVMHTLPELSRPIRALDRPEALRTFASAVREHVPEGGIVLTDESTMHQLGFYLAGPEAGSQRDLGDRWIEHEMADRRIVEMPVFYAAQVDRRLRERLASFLESDGAWIVWMNRGFPTDRPEEVLPRLGIRTVAELHTAGDSWLIRLHPRPEEPESKPEPEP